MKKKSTKKTKTPKKINYPKVENPVLSTQNSTVRSLPIKQTTKIIISNLKTFFSNKLNLILVLILFFLVAGTVFAAVKFLPKPQKGPLVQVDLPFDPNGPYALLSPRRDGNALVLDIFRVSEYDAINYVLQYESNGIDRGVNGELDTKHQSEYSQEILFGTCSKGDTTSTLHCVFDPNVQNGTLTLHIIKGNIQYNMVTTWHLQQPAVDLGVLTSADSHFTYTVASGSADLNNPDYINPNLTLVGWSIINDLSGVPKIPQGKTILGKVYALNIPAAKTLDPGSLSIELANDLPKDAKINQYISSENRWQELDSTLKGDTITAEGQGAGIFAVLANSSSSSP